MRLSSTGPRTSSGVALASALAGCSLWGINAVVAQVVFNTYAFPPLALVAIRMPFAGLILFAVIRPRMPKTLLRQFLVFSFAGLFLAQLTYFLTIAYSNAATATFLQFLCLPMIAVYGLVTSRERLTPGLVVAILMAVAGTAELVAGRSNGSIGLIINPAALFAGLLVAGTSAFYIVASKPLLKVYGSATLTCWGLLFGSLFAVPTGYVSALGYSLPASGGVVELLVLALFVIVFGTLLPFALYLKGLETIGPTEAAIVSAMEPIAAAIVSFAVLHILLTPFQYLGGALIIGAVAFIVLRPKT